MRFDEHKVVLPIVVITELEAKRNHPELGYFARQALRHLDDLRIEHGRLDAELPLGTFGGTVRVELNHQDPQVLPAGFRLGDNDSRILSVACSLAAEGALHPVCHAVPLPEQHVADNPGGVLHLPAGRCLVEEGVGAARDPVAGAAGDSHLLHPYAASGEFLQQERLDLGPQLGHE